MFSRLLSARAWCHNNVKVASRFRKFSNAAATNPSGGFDMGVLVFGGVCLGAFGLGCWQVQRYNWKVDLIAELKQKFAESNQQATVPLLLDRQQVSSSAAKGGGGVAGRRYIVRGEFLHDREVLLGPRGAPLRVGPQRQGMSSSPQGYYVITPMRIITQPSTGVKNKARQSSSNGDSDSSSDIVFVNRGWVPRDMQSWGRPEGTVDVECLTAACEAVRNLLGIDIIVLGV